MESRLTDEQKSQLLTYFATSFLPEKRLHLDSQILSMSFSSNPQKLMIGSLGGMVEVDLQTEQTKKLDSQIQAFHAYSPDYTKVAVVSKFRDVRIGDSLENIHTRFSEESNIVSMAFSPDNTLFACGLSNNSVVVRNLETNESKLLLHVPLNPEDGRYPIYSLMFSPDGTQLVSGANNGLLLWDIAQGTCLQLCYGNPIMTVAVRPQTNEFVTGNTNGVLRVWDFEKQRCKQSFDVGKSIESLAFTADGKWLVIGDSATLRLCNCQTKMSTVLNLLTNFDSYTSTDLITLSPDGNDLVTKSFACNVVRDLRGFYKLSEKLEKDDISDEELVLFKKYAHNPQIHTVATKDEWDKLCKEPDDSEGWDKFRKLKHAEGQQWGKFIEIMAAFNQEPRVTFY
jgi:WD40 repeat protein